MWARGTRACKNYFHIGPLISTVTWAKSKWKVENLEDLAARARSCSAPRGSLYLLA